jgi:pyruvate ferredoxin oxidoreductase beta subunit
MNTGIQRSSQTPYMAWTTTTLKGKEHLKKDMPSIMAAHDISYTAAASIGFHQDLIQKFIKARDKGPGFKYIHFFSPCPPGWRFPENKTISVSRLAVETGIWPLYEVENGKTQLTYKPEPKKPIRDYLGMQGRFSSLMDKQIEFLQERVDQKWESLQY